MTAPAGLVPGRTAGYGRGVFVFGERSFTQRGLIGAVALLACALVALLAPALAAAVYEVDSTGDQADEALNGTCKTAANTCTLRAALEESNFSTGVVDTITFKPTEFEGKIADTITVATDLPTISAQVNIVGGRCVNTEAGVGIEGPCAGTVRSGSGPLFVVDADNVKIEGLAIAGASTGILVIEESDGFTARNDWIGLSLKGEALGNTTGIFLDPGSDSATIGGTEADERNVIGGNAGIGVDLEGASFATIQGNFFGVAPNGKTQRANGKNIEISDSTAGSGFQATNNEVGNVLPQAAIETQKCDGGCNVISGSPIGVDLDGDGGGANEAPASGPTAVHGNFIGLTSQDGTVVPGSTYGVLVGAAKEATIGGFGNGVANYVDGGEYGIYAEKAEDLVVVDNIIGRDNGGANSTPPSQIGIFVYSEGVPTEAAARVIANSIVMTGGVGIESVWTGATIQFNNISGGVLGIFTKGSSLGEGNLIEANTVRESDVGIVLSNDSNEVFANEILECEEAGILVRFAGSFIFPSPSNDNLIGGDEEGLENTIVDNFGPAIWIWNLTESNNEVGRNHGSGNVGPFIDLQNFEGQVTGPNEGVVPTLIAKATTTGVEGLGAQVGARIRIFKKASSEAGELDSFLGEAIADGTGNWKFAYPAAIPAGTLVTATQTTLAGGTSELAEPVATVASEDGGGGDGGGGSGGGSGGGNGGGGTPDITAPTVKITKAPKPKSTSTTATFKFKASEAGSTFQCKLDKGKFKSCRSPKTYKKLKPGKHVFKVRATDKAGNVGPAAKRKFTVLGK